MVCKECNATMYVDDRYKKVNGYEDIYYNCPKCQTSCIVEVRQSQLFAEFWHSENEGVKDYIIKHKIRRAK